MRRELLANTATVILVLCALVVTGLVVRRELGGAGQAVALSAPPVEQVEDWREYASVGHLLGPEEAPVTVVVFSDFQCGACGLLAPSLAELRRRYPRELRVLYRHFPLPMHDHAVPAALASECAAAQGRFEPFHDALFAAQAELGRVAWSELARRAAIPDQTRFAACMAAEDGAAVVERDTAAAARLRVRVTPTLLINGSRINGALPLPALEDYIHRELDRTEGRP